MGEDGNSVTFTEDTDSVAYTELGLEDVATVISSDAEVVTVADNGDTSAVDLTSVSEGTATITVTDTLDNIATIAVTVAEDGTISATPTPYHAD